MSVQQHIQELSLKPPTRSQQVFKDDCVYCFDTPFSPHGLDICLICFLATCPDPDRNHTAIHYATTNHAVFLNIHKELKPREESPAKIVKLAIEADREEDHYTMTTKVKDLKFDGGAEVPIELVQDVVDGVLSATSYSRKMDIKAWEMELVACEHVLSLEQQPVPENLQLKQCNDCDLKENLWLCLVCGNLGCGRAQFGGVGGNSHGLSHYQSSGHVVSVKLGSITPEGTADVFCYDCGDEVIDPQLKDHMAHWGINLATVEKTEKSLTEMQLEQNIRWDFSLTNKDGAELTPLFGKGFTGINNLGNSCYMSSVLQCLIALPGFYKAYNRISEDDIISTKNPAEDLYIQLCKIADALESGRYAKPDLSTTDTVKYQRGISPGMFRALMGKGHREFATMTQQDAFEFLTYLLGKISTYSKSHSKADPSELFKFNSERRIECTNCHKVRYKIEEQENVSIPVPIERLDDGSYRPVKLEECFDVYTSEDVIEGYKCNSCKQNVTAKAKMMFKTYPEVLVLNARRFTIENWVPIKLDIPVLIEETPFLLDKYESVHQEGEDVAEDNDENNEQQNAFSPDETALSSLEAMGFPRARCEKALYHTGNSNAEAAMEWLFQHMEDADIDEPLAISNKNNDSNGFSPEVIAQLTDMGFTAGQARRALTETHGNVEIAVSWLFDNPGAEELPEEVDSGSDQKLWGTAAPASYRLKSVICHKGGSIHAGHYVAFIRKEVDGKDQWVLYNDEKVVVGGDADELKEHAYVYFFERV